MKTRSAQMIGVELPRSGRGTRQRTFSFVLQRNGNLLSRQIPLPPTPRHAGQFSATPANVEAVMSRAVAACVLSAEKFAGNRDASGPPACGVIILFTLGRDG